MTPEAATRISTSPAEGSGRGRSTGVRTSGGPGREIAMTGACRYYAPAFLTSSTSIAIATSSLTTTPPPSSTRFQTRPKSFRLIVEAAVRQGPATWVLPAPARAGQSGCGGACLPSSPSCRRWSATTGASSGLTRSRPLRVMRTRTTRRSLRPRLRAMSPRRSMRSSSRVMSGSRVTRRSPTSPHDSPSGPAPLRMRRTLYLRRRQVGALEELGQAAHAARRPTAGGSGRPPPRATGRAASAGCRLELASHAARIVVYTTTVKTTVRNRDPRFEVRRRVPHRSPDPDLWPLEPVPCPLSPAIGVPVSDAACRAPRGTCARSRPARGRAPRPPARDARAAWRRRSAR